MIITRMRASVVEQKEKVIGLIEQGKFEQASVERAKLNSFVVEAECDHCGKKYLIPYGERDGSCKMCRGFVDDEPRRKRTRFA